MRIDGTAGSYPLHRESTPMAAPPQKYRKTATILAVQLTADVDVETPEGVMRAAAGDYLAEHQDGHAWPIKREIFEGTYEPA